MENIVHERKMRPLNVLTYKSTEKSLSLRCHNPFNSCRMEHTAPFFSPISRRMDIPDEDYTRAEPCVAMADALARSTNHSIYLIDYNRRNFLYVSPNPLFLCGRSPEEVRRKGYAFYFEVVPPARRYGQTAGNQ